jgi:hypothetical protein
LKGISRLLLISGIITLFIIGLSRCVSGEKAADPRGDAYAGSATCQTCHKDISEAFAANPHTKASGQVNHPDFQARFPADSNTFRFNNQLIIRVEKRDSGYYQVAYSNNKEIRSQRFDLIIGAGRNAATFAYWAGPDLKQLPLSFLNHAHGWANSPGYPDNRVYFDRPITSRCIECHGSFVEKISQNDGSLNRMEKIRKGSLIAGIDCERCHGPGREHAQFHTDHPEEKIAKHIVLYQQLSRKQQVDACAVCHSGNDIEAARSTFTFKPGDNLSGYYYDGAAAFNSSSQDVHGNQSKLMTKSKCYIISNTMTCNSCHSTHQKQTPTLAGYSKKCQSCHQNLEHPEVKLSEGVLKDNCIDCHMPKQVSSLISFQTAGSGRMNEYRLRTHQIAVYPIVHKN